MGHAAFREQFKKRFGNDIHVYAPYSYDATMTLVEAMKAAKSTDPGKYLESLKASNYTGVAGTVSFDASGDIKGGAVTVYQFKAGKWEPLQTIQ